MIETGARAGELRALKVGDFDLYRRTVTVLGKGSKRRLIPVSSEVTNALDEHYDGVPAPRADADREGHLWFPTYHVADRLIGLRPERSSSYRGFYEWWKRVERTAGVPHRKPHAMRHTFATDVLDATEGDLYAVKELLGHSSTRVTEVYLHSSRTRTVSAVEALAAYRSGARERD